MKANPASEKILFAFASPADATWQIVNDDVMGGVSSSRFVITNNTAVFSGQVSLKNNGGFASVRSLPTRHEWGAADGFVIRVRGDGRRYKFTARMNQNFDGANYQCPFPTKQGEWQELRLPLKDFVPSFRGRVFRDQPPLDAAKVVSLGFLISDQQEGPFELEVAWIKAWPIAGK
jgi:monofunctional biosynthetic peptidoglycan transglycosylase